MGDRRWFLGSVVFTPLGALLAYGGWKMYVSTPEMCAVCQRPLHERSKTVAMVDSKEETFCCPRCALSTHQQTGKPVKVISLTDYASDKTLDPKNAYIVEGSGLNLCLHNGHTMTDREGQIAVMDFDRCSPSMIAFGQQSAAAEFARANGGTVTPFARMAEAYLR
jgi:hypothetical protein